MSATEHDLVFLERPAAGEPQGLLVLHHGRGSSEHDLLPLGDHLDPERRLHVVAPRAPLDLGGFHWYVVPRVGYPDPPTFHAAVAALARFHDALWERLGIGPERTVLGGFSMGAVMSFSLGLGPGRPAPAGILAFSGFIPTVEGWQPGLPRPSRVLLAHGRQDPVISFAFAERAQAQLAGGVGALEVHEGDFGHWIEPPHADAARRWLAETLPRA